MPYGRRAVTLGVAGLLAVSAVSAVTWAATSHQHGTGHNVGSGSAVSIRSLAAAEIVTGSATVVTVATSSNATRVMGTVHRRTITFAHRGRSWTATLRRGTELRAGANDLTVSAAAGRGRTADRTATVYLTGARRQLGLVARNATLASATAVTVATPHPVAELAVTVNGTPLRGRLDHNLHTQRVALGAGDALRRGRNTIVVTAVDANGAWQRGSVSAIVDRSAPTAEAGADARGRLGVATTLDATRSHNATHARYVWTITRRPRGSKATVTRPGSARASFTPDVAGRYAFRVAVTSGGRTTADTTVRSVDGYVPPVGALIQTQAATSATYEIVQQGSTVVSMPQSSAGGSMIAVYDKQNLAPLGTATATADTSQVQAEVNLLNQARGLGSGDEVPVVAVISDAGGNGAAVAPLLSSLGIAEDANMAAGNPFSVVVVTGTTPYLVWRSSNGSASSTPGHPVGPGDLSGYLQATAGGVGPYTFVPDAHVPFDTAANSTPTSNTISLGCPGRFCVSRPSPALTTCQGAVNPGGFQVLVARAGTLRTSVNRTFTTNDGCTGPADATADAAAVTAIGALLANYPVNKAGSVDRLVVVQSIGTPRNVSTSQQSGNWTAVSDAWRSTALALVAYGATASEFANIGDASPQGYALVGSTSLPLPGSDSPYGQEVAAGNPSHAAPRLSGLLSRNHRNDFVAQVTTVGGPTDNVLGTTLYRSASAWPDTSTPGERNALAYITKTVGPTLGPGVTPSRGGECEEDPAHANFRDAYCDLTLQTYWPQISTQLANLATQPLPDLSPTTPQFSATDWTTVLTELSKETESLPEINAFVDDLKSPFDGGKTSVDLGQIVTDVNAALTPPATAVSSSSTWLGVVSDFFGLLWAVLPEPANAVSGVISEGITLGSALTSDSNGQPALATPVHDDADDLAGDLKTRLNAVAANIRFLFDIIVTDSAKLDTVRALASNGFTSVDVNASIKTLTTATQGWLYAHLIGSLFHPDLLTQSNPKGQAQVPWQLYPGDATTFTCHSPEAPSGRYRPFPGAQASQQYVALQSSPLATGPSDTHYVLAAPGTIKDYAPGTTKPALAPATDIARLFGTPQLGVKGSGLGYDKAHFFERDLGLSSGTTQTCQSQPSVGGGLAAASATPDRQTVFFVARGHIQGTTYSLLRDTWQGTPVLPGTPDGNSALAATSNAPGDLHVFYVANGTITNDWQDPGTAWQGPATLPGTPDKGSALAAVSTGSGTMFVFFLSKGQLTFDDYTTGAGWQGPVGIVGKPDGNSPLAAASFGPGDAHVFFLTGGKLQNVWSSNGSGWQGPVQLPGNPDRGSRSLAASNSPNGANVYFPTGGVPNNDYYESTGWQGPAQLPGRVGTSGLAAVRTGGAQPTRLFFSANGSIYSDDYVAGWQQPVVVLSSGR